MTLLFEWLQDAARRYPNKVAATFAGSSLPNQQISFSDLNLVSDKIATFLVDQGIAAGSRVAILCHNSLPALCWFWGVLKSGASTVDVPTSAGRDTIQSILDEAQVDGIAIDPQLLDKTLGPDTLQLPKMVLSTRDARIHVLPYEQQVYKLEDIVEQTVPRSLTIEVSPQDTALIVYTSGTTGKPNGVMLSHENFVSNLTATNQLMQLTSDDSILIVVPLYYVHGRMQLLLHTMLAGTVVFSSGFEFPPKILKELVYHAPTGFSGVPFHFKQLLEKTRLAQTVLPNLRYVLITGGALSIPELRQLQEAIPSVEIHLAYGQTEAAPRITWMGPDKLFLKPGSVGKALPNVNLEILGGAGEPLGVNQIGEVVAGGPNIMRGYVSGDHIALGRIDNFGRLKTGDLGFLDEDGYLFLVGRSSDLIKSAGERIYPQEVEEVLLRHSDVREAAVLGIPDSTLGERLVAYLVLRQDARLDPVQLKTHCLASLPFVRVPKTFKVVNELPKTGSGKVNRSMLKAQAAQGASQ